MWMRDIFAVTSDGHAPETDGRPTQEPPATTCGASPPRSPIAETLAPASAVVPARATRPCPVRPRRPERKRPVEIGQGCNPLGRSVRLSPVETRERRALRG